MPTHIQPIRAKTKRGVREAVIRIVRDIIRTPANPDVKKLRQQIGEAFVEVIQEEYIRKAHGGTDDAGIRWKRTQKFKETGVMMIRTGDLLDGFRVKVTQKGFEITNKVDYAKYALALRPAWPEDGEIPKRWINRMADKVTDLVLAYLQKRLSQEL